MLNLRDAYQFLGVSRDADSDTIHAAYRDLAKRTHPDVGGDPNAFETLKFVHDMLMDEDRRAHYDQTGEMLPASADNELAHILSVVSAALDEAMSATIQAQEDLARVDLMMRMRESIVRRCAQLERNSQEALGAAAKLEAIRGRFVNSALAEENYLENIVREKIRQAGEIVKNIATERQKLERVLQFLKPWSYRSTPATLIFTEPPPYVPKVTVDFSNPQTAQSASLQEQLAQEIYGIPPRS